MRDLPSLVAAVDRLLAVLDERAAEQAAAIEAVHPGHRAGALNLVHYTALRGEDVRSLQNDLMDIGLSSLATAEANVRAKVLAVRMALGALAGEPGPWDLGAVDDAIDDGDDLLDRHARDLLGPVPPPRTTRIMVTLPSEAAADRRVVDDLVDAGMDLARINCAHDDEQAWSVMAGYVRSAAERAGRPVGVYMDLGGPKLRTGPVLPGPRVVRVRPVRDARGEVVSPARVWLAGAPSTDGAAGGAAGETVAVPVDPAWVQRRDVGEALTFTDARGRRRRFKVAEVGEAGALAVGERTAYLETGLTLVAGSDRTTVGDLPALEQRLLLRQGDRVLLTADLTPVDPAARPLRLGCTLPEVVQALRPGHRVLLDDGEIEAVVEQVQPDGAWLLVTRTPPNGKRLGAEKGINVPDTDLPVSALTAADEQALASVVALADVVGLSFVRSPADVAHARERLAAAGGERVGIVLKIETSQAFVALPEILLEAMAWPQVGVMIARGDLMTEIGWERMSEVPSQVLSLCEAAHLPTIWATQVLESLAKRGVPSRAEIVDAAAGDRAECIMLNKGPHIVETVQTLDGLLGRTRRVQRKGRTLLRRVQSWSQ
jgi:pyruvate kinase